MGSPSKKKMYAEMKLDDELRAVTILRLLGAPIIDGVPARKRGCPPPGAGKHMMEWEKKIHRIRILRGRKYAYPDTVHIGETVDEFVARGGVIRRVEEAMEEECEL